MKILEFKNRGEQYYFRPEMPRIISEFKINGLGSIKEGDRRYIITPSMHLSDDMFWIYLRYRIKACT